ncbi:MAG TPA: DegT/DnrJ/EryC1/StrS family aminotransferase [Pyrinomonadaceae bacterium]|jgi:dTDP-4-amino-4,6-dideoxygalactose transaminase
MPVSFLNLKSQHSEIETEINSALSRVLKGGQYVLGREVEAFEKEWAGFCGVAAAAGVNSGTDALALALVASGAVRQGFRDEVVTSPLTAGYTALAIRMAGGLPIFADIDPQTYTLNPDSVERAITPHTRAIVPVHLYGQMADMDAIKRLAEHHDLVVIEDAAQAHGALSGGRRAGAHGHAAAFSFYPTKNLGAYGDGGAVTSDDLKLIERVKVLRQGGHPEAMRGKVVGANSRLDELQAAVLRVKLKHLDRWNKVRRELAEEYKSFFDRRSGILPPSANEPDAHVFHLYVVQHPERERLIAHLKHRGIQTMIHYPELLHRQPLFRSSAQGSLPVAESLVGKILSLPLHPHLSPAELQDLKNALLAFST